MKLENQPIASNDNMPQIYLNDSMINFVFYLPTYAQISKIQRKTSIG